MLESPKPCGWCSNGFQQIYHSGVCPKIESIEYHENGSIKKVIFKEQNKTITVDIEKEKQ